MDQLNNTRSELENEVARLQSDLAGEHELRRFYSRYQPFSGLLDYLASWDELHFFRCNAPLTAAVGTLSQKAVARFWTNKPVACCPNCRSNMVALDEVPYQILNGSAGGSVKLIMER